MDLLLEFHKITFKCPCMVSLLVRKLGIKIAAFVLKLRLSSIWSLIFYSHSKISWNWLKVSETHKKIDETHKKIAKTHWKMAETQKYEISRFLTFLENCQKQAWNGWMN